MRKKLFALTAFTVVPGFAITNQMPASAAPSPAFKAPAAAIDLKDHEKVKEAAEWIRENIAQGNEREAEIEKLSFDPGNGECEIEVRIRCRQVSGKIFGKPIVAYDYTLRAKGTFNAKTGRIDVVIDFGRGIKLNLKEIAGKLGGLVK